MTAKVNDVGLLVVVGFFDVTKPASICNQKKFRNHSLWTCSAHFNVIIPSLPQSRWLGSK